MHPARQGTLCVLSGPGLVVLQVRVVIGDVQANDGIGQLQWLLLPTTALAIFLAQCTILITEQGWHFLYIFCDIVADIADFVRGSPFWKVPVRNGEEHEAIPRSAIYLSIFAFQRLADITRGILEALYLQLKGGSELLGQVLYRPACHAIDLPTLAAFFDTIGDRREGGEDGAGNQGEHHECQEDLKQGKALLAPVWRFLTAPHTFPGYSDVRAALPPTRP